MKETRKYNNDNIEFRSITNDEGERIIEGYAAVFDKLSRLIIEPHKGKTEVFFEKIERGAFEGSFEGIDVKGNINHDNSKLLGRTSSGTLTLEVDEKGLKFRLLVPNTTIGNDTWELIKRGDYFECSFAFIIKEDSWEMRDGDLIRTIKQIGRVLDISIVNDGAYADTDIDIAYVARSIEKLNEESLKDQEEKEEKIDKSDRANEIKKMKLKMLKLK
ncbi:MAG: HK97 family phage prohead protease [bacterium]